MEIQFLTHKTDLVPYPHEIDNSVQSRCVILVGDMPHQARWSLGRAYEVHWPPIRFVENDLGIDRASGKNGHGILPRMWVDGDVRNEMVVEEEEKTY